MVTWQQKLTEASQRLGNLQRELAELIEQVPSLRCEAAYSSHDSLNDALTVRRGKEAGMIECPEHGWHPYSLPRFRKLAHKRCAEILATYHPILSGLKLFKSVGPQARVEIDELVTSISKADRTTYYTAADALVEAKSQKRRDEMRAKVDISQELLHEFYSCYRKIAHPTPAHARVHMEHLNEITTSGGLLHTYQCGYCTGWHVGHQPDSKEKQARSTRAAELLLHSEERAREFIAEKGLPQSVLKI